MREPDRWRGWRLLPPVALGAALGALAVALVLLAAACGDAEEVLPAETPAAMTCPQTLYHS